jgi:hypothetical protein
MRAMRTSKDRLIVQDIADAPSVLSVISCFMRGTRHATAVVTVRFGGISPSSRFYPLMWQEFIFDLHSYDHTSNGFIERKIINLNEFALELECGYSDRA